MTDGGGEGDEFDVGAAGGEMGGVAEDAVVLDLVRFNFFLYGRCATTARWLFRVHSTVIFLPSRTSPTTKAGTAQSHCGFPHMLWGASSVAGYALCSADTHSFAWRRVREGLHSTSTSSTDPALCVAQALQTRWALWPPTPAATWALRTAAARRMAAWKLSTLRRRHCSSTAKMQRIQPQVPQSQRRRKQQRAQYRTQRYRAR